MTIRMQYLWGLHLKELDAHLINFTSFVTYTPATSNYTTEFPGSLTGVVTAVTVTVVISVFIVATFVITMLVITRRKKAQG